MGLRTVQIWDATGNKRQEVQMPDDAPVNRLLVVLLEKMKFPRYAPDGQPLSYKFHHRASGKQLLDEQSLADVGVKDGDVLRLQPEITAGAGTLHDATETIPQAATLRISSEEAEASRDDRFHRFGLIQWWDQKKLAAAKVLVIGAGALGNEIIKNLALLGVGNVLIADMDRIENSNLSRSILYRAADNGAYKSKIAARAARDVYPGIRAHAFVGNVVHDLGLGVFRWADLVIGGLDNREARLAINRACWKTNRPWIDGAIEQIQGAARVFAPDGPCYECTMSESDWKLLQMRRSCNLLSRPEMEGGKTPTTPTISSIIAGIQCQEAVKLLHGLDTIKGRGLIFDGLSTETYQVEYQRKSTCYSHEILDQIESLDACADSATARDLLDEARRLLGPQAELELARDVLEKLVCPNCGSEETIFASLGRVRAEKAFCPSCKDVRREVVTFYKIRGDEDFFDRPLGQIGVPPFDILIARAGGRAIGLELGGDACQILGPLSDNEALQWE
jgi:molybdopterin/thiamine biosynthesis adenylyltransferase